jgi:phytoene synthase
VRPCDASTLAPGLRLLPTGVRDDVYRLYDALRAIDDAVDYDRPDAEAQLGAVENWAYGGPAESDAAAALADLAQRYPLSPRLLIELCTALRDDLARRRVETEEDLERYCARVGGSVALMVAQLLGTTDPSANARIGTLGRAMQLTNILRDIDVDLGRGRVYIARTTIERFGFPSPGARRELLRDQIARADRLYAEGLQGVRLLARGRYGIGVCAALYQEILRQIEREGFGSGEGTVAVPAWRVRAVIARRRLAELAI